MNTQELFQVLGSGSSITVPPDSRTIPVLNRLAACGLVSLKESGGKIISEILPEPSRCDISFFVGVKSGEDKWNLRDKIPSRKECFEVVNDMKKFLDGLPLPHDEIVPVSTTLVYHDSETN